MAPSTVTRENNMAVVRADALKLRCQPVRSFATILQSGGERVFGCQPVIHRHHGAARLGAQLLTKRVVAVEVADDPAAAVEIDDQR